MCLVIYGDLWHLWIWRTLFFCLFIFVNMLWIFILAWPMNTFTQNLSYTKLDKWRPFTQASFIWFVHKQFNKLQYRDHVKIPSSDCRPHLIPDTMCWWIFQFKDGCYCCCFKETFKDLRYTVYVYDMLRLEVDKGMNFTIQSSNQVIHDCYTVIKCITYTFFYLFIFFYYWHSQKSNL